MSAVVEKLDNWINVPLEQLAIDPKTIAYGVLKPGEFDPTGAPLIRIKDLKNDQIDTEELHYITKKLHNEFKRTRLEGGEVLVSIQGTIGRVAIVPEILKGANISRTLAVIRPAKQEFAKWILYFLKSPQAIKQMGEVVTGSTRDSWNLRDLRKLDVPLAPPEQQKRIVAKIEELFSHIDAGIEALKKAKQLLKQYRQSVLKAAVTGELTKEWREANKDKLEPASQLLERILKERRQKWEEQQIEQFKAKGKMPKDDKWKEKYVEPELYNKKPSFEIPTEWTWVYLGQMGEVIGGLTKNKKREQFELQLPYLRVANVYANELRLDDITMIGVQESELERLLLEKGDLLVVEGNGSPEQIGRLAIWDGSIDPCVHQNHLIKVRLQEKASGNYLMYWLSSLGGRDAILKVASSTSGLYTLSISKVSGLPIPLPPIEEQVEIHNIVSLKLSSIEHLENEIDVQLLKAERNKQSVLASAFSGNIQ
ncbi:MAG: restriction endonuclease subunit S [Candidatus Thiodiazotropha sp.]